MLAQHQDKFFEEILAYNYGQVAERINDHVQSHLRKRKSTAQVTSIEDMQKLVENFPEFKQGERNVTKHFKILEELRK